MSLKESTEKWDKSDHKNQKKQEKPGVLQSKAGKIVVSGIIGGAVGYAVTAAIFSTQAVKEIIFNPDIQSKVFISLLQNGNMPLAAAGLILLSVIHSWLFELLRPSIPGHTWFAKGLFWGLVIWLMFWLFQEWFVFLALVKQPWHLSAFELLLKLPGALIEGAIIAYIIMVKPKKQEDWVSVGELR